MQILLRLVCFHCATLLDNGRLDRTDQLRSMRAAKATIPADRLCLIRLEDGLGWEQICPFLGVPIPDQEYPERNEPRRFQVIVQGFVQPRVTAAVLKLSALAAPVLGILGWMSINYGPSLLGTLAR